MKLPVLLLLACLGLGLVACGQKGPLYLPSENPEQGSGEPETEAPAKTEKPADAH